jgi:hypothetical protein
MSWNKQQLKQTHEVSLRQKYVNKTKLKFEALMMLVITIKIDLWDMMPCSLLNTY